MTASAQDKLIREHREKIAAQHAEWEKSSPKWPTWLKTYTWEESRIWLRGVYRDGKDFNWM